MLKLNKDNFKEEVLESKTPVVVDFWSHGCGPCRTMEKTLLAVDGKTPTKIAKMEVEDGENVFAEYRVNAVPTFILFKDGKEVDRKKGIVNEKEFTEWLSK